MLQQIPVTDVHKITSGQVIVDLRTCLKELIENAIDAHAKRVEIVIKNYGIQSLELSDDGDGITELDYDKICLNHYTSKIEKFSDVSEVRTFGFRGELMSSICGIAELSILTKTTDQKILTKLKYDHLGQLVEKSKSSRNKGTTVVVEKLFHNLPVRKQNFVKHSRKEFIKMINLIQQYCIITDLRFIVHHITNDGKKKLVLSSQGNQSMLSNITQVYNKQFSSTLELIEMNIPELEIVVIGYISNCSFGQGRSSGDRQMLFLNGRPIALPKLNKLINEIYKTFNHLETPSFFLDLQMDPRMVDLNITPDKMTVLISKEFQIFEILKLKLLEFFDNQAHLLPKNSNGEIDKRQSDLSSMLSSELDTMSEPVQGSTQENTDDSFAQIRASIRKRVAPIESQDGVIVKRREIYIKLSQSEISQDDEEGNVSVVKEEEEVENINEPVGVNEEDETLDESLNEPVENDNDEPIEESNKEDKDEEEQCADRQDEDEVDPDVDMDVDVKSDIDSENMESDDIDTKSDIKLQSKLNLQRYDLYVNIDKQDYQVQIPQTEQTPQILEDVEISDLSKQQISIKKSQFSEMQIIGQFNLGFIIVRLIIDNILNLLIVDQHASDEKYNFETLMKHTVLNPQKLISPINLLKNLNSMDELIVRDNLGIFDKNGFQINHDGDELSLLTTPMSKNIVFNIQDFEELIHLIKSNPHNPNIRPSKIYKMFASRACRSSVMIGDHLTTTKMQKLVHQLSTIDKPWNCPHGRPTMRHLLLLDSASCFNDDYYY